jgi:endo-1,4-beta-xylanase
MQMKTMNSVRTMAGVVCVLLSIINLPAADLPKEILLWPNGAPGSEGKTNNETVRLTDLGEHVVATIHRPSITPFIPAAGKATGCAVIVAPGGAHRELWIDHEGYDVARWLSEHGIAAFVLKYRLARQTNSTYTVNKDALGDMQRAIQLVRSRAGEWHIATNRLGVMGFSAGGEVAYLSAMDYDWASPKDADVVAKQNSRPDFQALIYPGWLERLQPTTNTPPAFLVCGYNDNISEQCASAYLRLRKAKVPAELHIYTGVGHGFGLRPTHKPVDQWIDRFQQWLSEQGFISDSETTSASVRR